MLGYDVSWASFSIVEVMSQPKFSIRRLGFLAANQVLINIILILIFMNLITLELYYRLSMMKQTFYY